MKEKAEKEKLQNAVDYARNLLRDVDAVLKE